MLIPTDTFFENIPSLIPKTENERIIKALYKMFSSKPWYSRLYQDVVTNKKTSYTVKCKYEIDVDEQPSTIEGWQLKFAWEGKKDLTIEEAVEKFRKKFEKKQWFHDVQILDGSIIEVILESWLNVNNRFDYYENFPVQYGLLPDKIEEDLPNLP